mmetsp:Transcript_32002/g.66804  ORF Transcript_32002/g.66804 Transcript_32002/m.66804 type:complete len:217 (-) Transcript_32002:123-773(-)
MTPLALTQCLIMSVLTGEIQEIAQRWPHDFSPWGPKGWYPSSIVNLTGLISLTFNVSSLQVNKLTSPLTLCVAANVKQVLNIVIATAMFHTEITPLNAAGIVLVLMGSAWYSYVSSIEKMARLTSLANTTHNAQSHVEEKTTQRWYNLFGVFSQSTTSRFLLVVIGFLLVSSLVNPFPALVSYTPGGVLERKLGTVRAAVSSNNCHGSSNSSSICT